MKLDRDVPCMCVHVCVSPTKPSDGPSASLKVSRESKAFSRAVKKKQCRAIRPESPVDLQPRVWCLTVASRGHPDINRSPRV